jgi:hypothetical protein
MGGLISERLSKKKAVEVNEPDRELQRVTNNLQKPCGEYRKIKHAVESLKLLDINKLANEFSEFRRLTEKLQ